MVRYHVQATQTTNNKTLNSEIETLLTVPYRLVSVPTNNKTLNSEIETQFVEGGVDVAVSLRIIRLSILRLKPETTNDLFSSYFHYE